MASHAPPLSTRRARRHPRPVMLAAALLVTVALPADVTAQTVVGEAVERDSADPLPGVFVALLDSAGRQVAAVLTDDRGRFRLRAPAPGRYTLRAERIGFRTVHSDVIDVGDATLLHRFELDSHAVRLDALVVGADRDDTRRCRVRPEEGSRLQAIWEQVRIALDVALWTEQSEQLRAGQLTWERWIHPVSGRVQEEQVQARRTRGGVGFAAAPPDELLVGGFIQPRDDGYVFYGLDASTITSDAFLDTHCFRLLEARRGDTRLGLMFEPVRGRTQPGVRGVLWLDPLTAELRALDYTYTWLPWALPLEAFGGEATFRRLPTGAWIVEHWAIRMPQVQRAPPDFTWSRLPGRDVLARLHREAGLLIKEDGGEVAALYTAAGEALPVAGRAALEGVVYDSLRGRPLAGARVWLDGTTYQATADDRGRYRLDDLPPGVYGVRFSHPDLEAWRMEPPAVDAALRRGDVSTRDLAVSFTAMAIEKGCRAPRPGQGGPLIGRVVDARTGQPVRGASVRLHAPGQDADDSLQVWTDAAGVYRLCDVPPRHHATLAADYLGHARLETTVSTAGTVFHEFALRLDAPSRLNGRVLDAGTGDPVPGVTLRLGTAHATAVSGHDGRFLFADVPPGRHPLAASHVAYADVRDTVRVDGTGRPFHVDVRLAAGAIPLDPIVVSVAARPVSGVLAQVYDRIDRVRTWGGGTVMDREQIERRGGTQVTRLIEEVRGVRIVPLRTGDTTTPLVTSTRAFSGMDLCVMTIYIDGIMVFRGGADDQPPNNINDLVFASNIEAIEVYHPSDRIPPEYAGSYAGCGVVLIWTKR